MAVPFVDQNRLHCFILLLSVLLVVLVLDMEPAPSAPEGKIGCSMKPRSARRPTVEEPNCRMTSDRDAGIPEPRLQTPRSPIDLQSVGSDRFGTDFTGTCLEPVWIARHHMLLAFLLLAASVRCAILKEFAEL